MNKKSLYLGAEKTQNPTSFLTLNSVFILSLAPVDFFLVILPLVTCNLD